MRLFDKKMIMDLYQEAERSERKRSHFLLHKSHSETVQRLLIALVEGSFVEPHYHELANQWEMFIVMRGQLRIKLYDNQGNVVNDFIAGPELPVSVVEFQPGDIHSVECISEQALMMEIKEGPFNPEFAKTFPKWQAV
ncbi:metalloprotein [Pantoea alhagi]|uniref:Metalloprotein n=1 Tax=Pantoea alhagi TaxID=1891675 RepID=A0A1W6B7T8_9GAMM|nr:WbuC family cupin fold metalloprotein [Pantoea alhagi]ARJ43137.1 metalloprotein [Pantoea alhagi]